MANQMNEDELMAFAEEQRQQAFWAEKAGDPRRARELAALARRAEMMATSRLENYFRAQV